MRKTLATLGLIGGLLASAGAWATPWSTATHTLAIGDFNGDGKSDVLYIANDAGGVSGIAFSDGTGPNIASQSWASNYLGIPWADKTYQPIIGDFNGDGKADILLQRQTQGDSYLLLADASGKFTSISQQIAWNAGGQSWSADAHRLVAGDFNGDGRTDLFMQATNSSVVSAVYLAGAGGVFTSPTQTWGASYMGFQWTLVKSIVYSGDFNGDGKWDLFVQAKPDWIMIDYDVPFPVPKYRPGSFGIVNAKVASGADYFYGAALQIWDRNYQGGDWSAANTNAVIGDFNGDGKADIFLQPRSAGRNAQLYVSDAAGSGQFISGNQIQGTNLSAYPASAARALAARFSGTGPAGLYLQSTAPNGTNQYATGLTLATVTYMAHDPGLLNNVTPGTAVGAIPGEFSVDPSGSASYSVKIAVPPGVAGVAPDLTLSYSSRGGNGPLGVGWGLSGMSAITRCPTTVATDGFADGVDFDGNDAFCLDGQRLKVIGGVANGAVGAKYRTELESFQDVASTGGTADNPDSFTVRDKAGLTRTYGTTNDNTASGADSRFEARRPGATGQVVVWAVKKITDRFGNFIEYRYDQDLTTLNFWPVEITYGSNPSGAATIVGRVAFTYTTRSDVTAGFMAGGFQSAQTQRLQKITVYGRTNPTVSGANDKVREYYLNYEQSTTTKLSHLASLVLCDGGATPSVQRCVKDTKLQWQYGYRGFTNVATGTGVTVASTADLKVADFDGDGHNDYVYHPQAGGNWAVRYASLAYTKGAARTETGTGVAVHQADRAITMDWNNDGYPDLVQADTNFTGNSGYSGNYQVLMGGPSGLGAAQTMAIPARGLSADNLRGVVGDFDGDGRQDIADVNDPTVITMRLNNGAAGTGLEAGTQVVSGSFPGTADPCGGGCVDLGTAAQIAPFNPPTRSDPAIYVINFDGDGKDDLMVRVSDCWTDGTTTLCNNAYQVYSYVAGASPALQLVWTSTVNASALHIKVGDYNGDGISDLLYWGYGMSQIGTLGWHLDLGTGSKGVGVAPFQNVFAATSLPLQQVCTDVNYGVFDNSGPVCSASSITLTEQMLIDATPIDYDRNGLTDLLMAKDGLWQVLPGGPNGFLSELWSTDRAAINPTKAMVVDDNADGVVDILYPAGLGPTDNWAMYFGRGPGVSGVIEKITDGLGAQTTVQYTPLTATVDNVNYAGTVYKGHTRLVEDALSSTEAGFTTVAVLGFPLTHVAAPIGVVEQFAADNGLGSPGGTTSSVRTSYEYWGLKADRSGRGLLGFSRVRSWNDNSEIETVNKMVQSYPYTGMVVTSEQRFRDQATYASSMAGYSVNPANLQLNYITGCDSDAWCAALNPTEPAPAFNAGGGGYTRVSYTTNTFNAMTLTWPAGGTTQFPYVRKSVAEVNPVSNGTPGATPYKRTVTEYVSGTGQSADSDPSPGYSTYGNPAVIRVTTSDGTGTGDVHKITTANTYTDDPTNWCLARLTGTTVTHEKPNTNSPANPGAPTVTRTASFVYQSGAQCVLTEENTEPGTPALRLRKTYAYDAYGNRYKETVDDGVNVAAARTSGAMLADGSSSYVATQGQFPTETRNALGHRELTGWDGRFGVATSVQGPNDLVATSTYDSFGVKLRETPISALPGIYSEQKLYWCSGTGVCSDARSIYAVRSTASDGSQSWSEFDRLSRGVLSRKLGFDGGWIYSEKYYDALGREYLASDPYTSAQSAAKCWSFKRFDALGRPIATWESYASSECTATPIPATATSTADGFPGAGRTSSITYDIVGPAGIGTMTVGNAGDTSGYATARTAYKFVNVMGRTRFVRDEIGTPLCPAGGAALAANTAGCLQTEYDYDAQGNLSYTKQVGTVGAGLNGASKTLETKVSFNNRGFKTSMVDPDMGAWSYTYSNFGELLTQLDAKGQQTVLTYDKLGRMLTRVEQLTAGGTTESSATWTYDTATKGIGKLANVNQTTQGGYVENYLYDSYGRLSQVKRQIGSSYFFIDQAYDGLGRVDTVKFPGSVAGDTSTGPEADANRLRVRNNYNAYGYLASVQDVASGTAYWTADSVDEQGRVRQETLGNGLKTQRYYDQATGYLGSIKTGTTPGGVSIQDLSVSFDQAANLRVRKDNTAGVNAGAGIREEYDYDKIYRLAQRRQYKPSTGTAATLTDNYAFDGFGNLTTKGTSYTSYCYNTQAATPADACAGVTNTRPHAVARVTAGGTARNYSYDANGNLTAATNAAYASVTWYVSNLANRVTKTGGTYSEFSYGPDRSRFKQFLFRTATNSDTTIYVGGAYEKVTKVNGGTTTVEHTHYIRAGDQVITIAKRTGTGALWFRYPHRDHLGSIVALTDASGALIERSGFDPWGKRTDYSTWDPPPVNTFLKGGSGAGGTTNAVTSTTRGFTGHEMVDELGFIHMNGRIYDPEIGKFMSADPTMQFPESTQGFNRYAYAGNNPLTNVDPSGFGFFKGLMKAIGWLNLIATFFFPPLGFWGAAINGFITGFLITGGNLKAGLISGITAGLMNGIGDMFKKIADSAKGALKGTLTATQKFGKALLEGVVGGAASIAGGGKLKDGFLGAFASSLAASEFALSSNEALRTVQEVVIGGTLSVIGGGSFGNGAVSAAFAALFNDASHRLGARVSAKINKILEVGIDTNDGLRASFQARASDSFEVSVDTRGRAKVKAGNQVYEFDAAQAMDGSGIKLGWVEVTVRVNPDGLMRVSGKVGTPEYLLGRLGIELGFTGYTEFNIRNQVMENTGLLGNAARSINQPIRRSGVPKEVCQATGDC